ncbi:MAG: TonB-dependent receptor plug domain-containing protein [Alphaproteobacteria bacterium]|nr:TonB-dependent receptor plug domain-containing protein [Alphaproteobacteria bacterium]
MLLLVAMPLALAQDAPGTEVVVEEAPPAESASARSLDREDILATPARSPEELLRATPGLHTSAHGGRGKAAQYLLRGFDATHGADLAVSLEGVPLNEPSHVHAHGYLDLHAIPMALIRGATLSPGPYRPEVADFGIAGSAALSLGLEQPGGQARLSGGSDASGGLSLAWRPPSRGPGSFVLAEVEGGQGVGMSRAYRQLRGAAGLDGALGGAMARAWVLAYDGRFESPGVLREDDWLAGELGFYDAYPGSGGGRSQRVLGATQLAGGGAKGAWQATAWAGWRGFSLQQNYTGWLTDLEHGDGTQQDHQAWSGGAQARGLRTWARLDLQGGASVRLDRLHHQEQAITIEGEPWAELDALSATQSALGAWAGLDLRLKPWLHVEPALRADLFIVTTEGRALGPALSPKLKLTAFEGHRVTGFLSAGRGVRSPDARAAGVGRAPVAVADSAELGALAQLTPALRVQGALFGTLVSDEIVFDHLSARYLPTGATRRAGVYARAAWQPAETWTAALELTASDARYRESGELLPYAPRLLAVATLQSRALPLSGLDWTGGLRAWALGPRPLPSGFASAPAASADLTLTGQGERWAGTLEIDDVLGTRWQDGAFVYASRWDPAAPASELPVLHFTAGTPPAARLRLTRSF